MDNMDVLAVTGPVRSGYRTRDPRVLSGFFKPDIINTQMAAENVDALSVTGPARKGQPTQDPRMLSGFFQPDAINIRLPVDNKKGQKNVRSCQAGKVDQSEESNKRVRPFKFALTAFLRDLIKPAWEDGKISVDAHKIILKKAVEKVINSFKASQFPESKESIQRYLECSTPKLSKLVEEYVKKHKKR